MIFQKTTHPNYSVNELGQFRNDDTGLILKDRRVGNYLGVQLGKGNNVYAHREVYKAFKGEIPSGYEVDHVNENRLDNRLENLQLLTPSQNSSKAAMKRKKSELPLYITKLTVKGNTYFRYILKGKVIFSSKNLDEVVEFKNNNL